MAQRLGLDAEDAELKTVVAAAVDGFLASRQPADNEDEPTPSQGSSRKRAAGGKKQSEEKVTSSSDSDDELADEKPPPKKKNKTTTAAGPRKQRAPTPGPTPNAKPDMQSETQFKKLTTITR